MNAPIDPSLLPLTARIDAHGRMSIGGCDLEALATTYGTPLFVYDEDDIRARVFRYAELFGADNVFYASKAFTCTALTSLVAQEGFGIDVASAGELAIALRGGIPAERILLHGNNKSLADLEGAIAAGVGRIVVDSFDECDRLATLADAGHPIPRLLVRVTPGIEAHTHEYITTGIEDTKFGFSIGNGDAARAVAGLRAHPGLPLVGLHCHIGSQIFATEPLACTVEVLATFVRDLDVSIDELDLGGGLGIAYTLADKPLEIAEYAETLRTAVVDAWSAHELGAPPRLMVEPGRSIVGTAGVTLYRVGTIKDIPDVRTYVSVDGGMSDNIRHALYGAQYETFLPARADAQRPRVVTITGTHCEQGDIITTDAHLPAGLALGDVVCTPATGAYGSSMASNYNAVPRPAVVFVRNGTAREVVRRETLDDLLRLQS